MKVLRLVSSDRFANSPVADDAALGWKAWLFAGYLAGVLAMASALLVPYVRLRR